MLRVAYTHDAACDDQAGGTGRPPSKHTFRSLGDKLLVEGSVVHLGGAPHLERIRHKRPYDAFEIRQ